MFESYPDYKNHSQKKIHVNHLLFYYIINNLLYVEIRQKSN